MNFTLLFSIFTTIAVVSIIFSVSMSLYINTYDSDWYGILSKNVSDEFPKEKIFLLGSSTVYSVNSSLVNHHFVMNGINYEFFNLADMSDSPKKRIHSMSNIISNDPKIVIYGIDIGNFRIEDKNEISLDDIILNPKNFFLYQFNDLLEQIKEKIPGSPKDRSLLTLKYFFFGPQPHNHPFVNFYQTAITPIDELKQNHQTSTELQKLDISDNSEEITSLKKITSEFKKNNIKLILFSAPKLIQDVNDEDIDFFEQSLVNYSEKYDVPVYFLHDRYMNMEIWRDSQHVAINNDTKIYTEDILKILLTEME
jgi:hypothetical protein